MKTSMRSEKKNKVETKPTQYKSANESEKVKNYEKKDDNEGLLFVCQGRGAVPSEPITATYFNFLEFDVLFKTVTWAHVRIILKR
jgi:hypothetical protein